MHARKALLTIFISLLPVFPATGYDYLVEHFSCPEGLSDSNVMAMECDGNGIIWVGTHNGLNRYDGHRFRHYSLPAGHNIIRYLCIDGEGMVWASTSWGVFRLNPWSETIDSPVSDCQISQIANIGDENIAVITADDRILVINTRELSRKSINFPAKTLAVGERDIYVLGKDNELYVSDGTFSRFVKFETAGGRNPFAENGGSKEIRYAAGYIFSGTPNNAFAVELRTGNVIRVPWVMTWKVIERPDGTLIAATNQGLYILDRELNPISHYSQSEPSPGFLRDDAIQTACKDKCGGIWLGTYYNGITHLAPNYADIKYYDSFAGNGGSVRVREIVQDDDDRIWFGTETEGLFRLDPESGKIKSIPLPPSTSRNVIGLLADGNTILLGTYSSSTPVLSLDRKSLTVRYHEEIGTNCSKICKDGYGGIWASCSEGVRYKGKDEEQFTTVRLQNDARFVKVVSDYTDCSIWMSSHYSYIFHIKGEEITTYTASKGNLPSSSITNILCDSHNRIWVTAEGTGILRYDRSSDSFTRYFGKEEGETFLCITEDKRGMLWATSIGGILAFNPDSGYSRFFTSKDGIGVDKFNNSSLLYSRDDRIYAGSSSGMISFNACAMTESGDANDIIITDINLLNRKSNNRRLDASLYKSGELTLSHGDNSFDIYVTDTDYSIPRHTHLEYKTDGLDKSWTSVSNGAIAFTGIPTGRYTLRLRSVRGDGTVSGQEKVLKIVVKPHIMASLPMILLYFILAAVLIYFVIRVANRRGAEAAARKAALKAEKQEVENEKKLYASKVEFLSNIAHEIRTPLALIRLPLESLKNKLHSSPDTSVRENLDIIDNNSEKLGQFIDELLDFQKLEKAGYSLNLAEYDICEIVRAETDRFQIGARRKKIEYSVYIDTPPCYASIDKSMFEKILWNLCSNAVKYAKSHISISLDRTDEEMCFKIENDGEIVPLNMRENIFKPFVRCQNGNYAVAGTGLGLSTSRNFASLMGGTLAMDEDTDVNRFILRIPITHTAINSLKSPENSGSGSADWKFPEIQGHSNTLMIVEDNDEMSLFLKRQFEPVFNILTVGDGAQALDMIKAGALPSIIITDIMMPEMDGFELCRKIKSSNDTCHIPVILLSAKSDVDSQIQGYDYGADAYLQKPFSTELLATTVRSILENRSRLMGHYASNPIVDSVKLKADSPDTKFLRITQEYVMEHIGEPEMKIEELAEAASTSVSRLQKRMKALIGTGPNEYIQQLRLKKAAELLLDESIAVSDVSLKVGFSSHSYFSSSFRKKYGVTPKQYRENKGKIKL